MTVRRVAAAAALAAPTGVKRIMSRRSTARPIACHGVQVVPLEVVEVDAVLGQQRRDPCEDLLRRPRHVPDLGHTGHRLRRPPSPVRYRPHPATARGAARC
jgi:hypothetical protein